MTAPKKSNVRDRELPLGDNDVFPFGKHRDQGTTMQFVPLSYFRHILTQPWILEWPAVYAYAQRTLRAFITQPPPKKIPHSALRTPRLPQAEQDRIVAESLQKFRADIANPKS